MEENHKKGKKKENHTTGKPLKQKGKWEKKKKTENKNVSRETFLVKEGKPYDRSAAAW